VKQVLVIRALISWGTAEQCRCYCCSPFTPRVCC